MSVIAVDGLVKQYADKRAVDEVSFRVEAGEVYALLGQNGAGKSTTVEILEGHRTRTAGRVEVLGADPATAGRDLRDRIGIVLQSSGMELKLTVRETIDVHRACYRRPRPVAECIELVGLGAAADQRVETLSGGQKRRLDLAVGIVGTPELLFLDEPTTGFDPAARRGAWELVRALCSAGTTVVLTSHYLDEVEHLADRIGVLVEGRLVREGTPGSLVAGSGSTVVRFGLSTDHDGAELAGVIGAAGRARVARGRVEIDTMAPTSVVHALTGWALERGIELDDLTVARPTLEDVFLDLIAETGQRDTVG